MKTKWLVGISLALFFVGLISVLTAGLVIYELKKDSPRQTRKPSGMFADILEDRVDTGFILNPEEVAKHNKETDCWMIINYNIYDLTSFLSDHPGGKASMLPYCGGDGTQAFNTKDKNPAASHSTFAQGLLENYYIGPVGETLASKPLPKPSQISIAQFPSPPLQTEINLAANQGTGQSSNLLILTAAEVATHNTLQNCWIIISAIVYDVTNYIAVHPGGAKAITNTCGTDATFAFQTKGGKNKDHSSNAYNLLNNYKIGSIGSAVNVTNPAPTPTGSANNSPSSGNLPDSVLQKYPGATIIKQKIEDDGRQDITLNYQGQCIKIKTGKNGEIKKEEKCAKED